MTNKNHFTVKIIGLLCLAICGTGLLYGLLSPSPASKPNNTPQGTRAEAPQANKTPSSAGDKVDQVPEANLSARPLESGISIEHLLVLVVFVYFFCKYGQIPIELFYKVRFQ